MLALRTITAESQLADQIKKREVPSRESQVRDLLTANVTMKQKLADLQRKLQEETQSLEKSKVMAQNTIFQRIAQKQLDSEAKTMLMFSHSKQKQNKLTRNKLRDLTSTIEDERRKRATI